MPRQVRIRYPGAIYHVMARGDVSGEAIFLDEDDRRIFLASLGDACSRRGWLCHAYVLMANHYDLVIETPEPNLVAGMAWLQNEYTRQHNVRHRLWGHVFGGRYSRGSETDSTGCCLWGDRRSIINAVPLDWIAGRIDMGARSTVSREIGTVEKELPKDARMKRLRAKILAADE